MNTSQVKTHMIKAIFMDFGDTVVVEEEGKKLSDMKLEPVKGVGKFLEEFSSKIPIIIISNTIHSREGDILKLLKELGFLNYIRKVVTSLDFGVEKPDPRIYQSALSLLELAPEEAIMIGDRIDTDILGAKEAGMKSIHLHWRERHDGEAKNSTAQPTYQFASFDEISKFLRKWVGQLG